MRDQSVQEIAPAPAAAGFVDDIVAALQFFRLGFRQYQLNASFVPSSRRVVSTMVGAAPLAEARTIVEFGPGTGVITRGILDAMAPSARLAAIELDTGLLATTLRRMRDPRVVGIHGSATDAPALLAARGIQTPVDVVFSSVPIAIMSDELRASVEEAARAILRPDGMLVQFHYVHTRLVTYQFGNGWRSFNAIGFHGRYFSEVRRKLVVANFPPCWVYICRHPRPPKQGVP